MVRLAQRALARREANALARITGEHERRVARLELQRKARRGEPETLQRAAGGNVIVDRARRLVCDDCHVRGAREAGNEVELDSRRERAGEIAVQQIDAPPARHRPAHQRERGRACAERRGGDPVLARLRVPVDDVAMDRVRLGNRQPDLRVAEVEPRSLRAAAAAFEPSQREARCDRPLERVLLRTGQRPRGERAALHAPLTDVRNERILGDSRVRPEAHIEHRPLVARAGSPRDVGRPSEAGRRDRDRLEQRADRDLARMSVEVVDAMAPRVEPEYGDAIVGVDRKAPRLRVVAARRPAREVENLTYRGRHGALSDGASRRPIAASCRRAIAIATRCSGLRFPQGRHVRTSLPR